MEDDVPEDEDEELLDDDPVPLELDVDAPLDVEGLLGLLLARESSRNRFSDWAKFKTVRLAKASTPTANLSCFIKLVFIYTHYSQIYRLIASIAHATGRFALEHFGVMPVVCSAECQDG